MAQYLLEIDHPRPFFAELPYYLWGQVNYNSDGDCESPTDQDWTWLELTHRGTREYVSVEQSEGRWAIDASEPLAARTALFLQERVGARMVQGTLPPLPDWDHEQALLRAAQVRANFEPSELAPFAVGDYFWGSWKWIGAFATEFTWVGRVIMHAVTRRDPRAVELCVDWLREGTVAEAQSAALRYALHHFTGLTFPTDAAWVRWYDQDGSKTYPEPDYAAWRHDIEAEAAVER